MLEPISFMLGGFSPSRRGSSRNVRRTFASYLVDEGLIDTRSAEAAVCAAEEFREAIGALALRLGVIQPNQIEGALRESDHHVPFNDLMVGGGYMQQSDLDNLLMVQAMECAVKIGSYLMYHGIISKEIFLEKFREFFIGSNQPVSSR
jgi:hypothetical protein